MKQSIHSVMALLALMAFSGTCLCATEFRLGSPLSDHMVLQRDKPVAIWGWADAGENISVTFSGQTKTAQADADGRWSLKLDALPANAQPQSLIVTGHNTHKLQVQDVLVGEVWLGSGQSNMAMTVARCNQFDAEKSAAHLPLIRHYRETSGAADQPQAEGKGSWQICTPETVGSFSAALYFFGRELHREIGVPVGLINTSVGGTPIEAWLSADAQQADAATKTNYDQRLAAYLAFDAAAAAERHQSQMAKWKAAAAKAKADGKAFTTVAPRNPVAQHKLKGGPAGLFNGKVFNLAPYTLRGMLWYQGEANTRSQPELYHKQLSQLVTSWRALWKDELPFAWVQLPNYTAEGEGWPRVRESMLKTLELPNTGMAITIDLGDKKDIHPKNKQDVGKRLSYWALGTVYGRQVAAISGPIPAGSEAKGNSIVVSFKHANGLRSITGMPLSGFEIAGADRIWKQAEAKIVEETVVVSSPDVNAPVAVRYAWKDWPAYSLANGAGLPASPFRTDNWPAPK